MGKKNKRYRKSKYERICKCCGNEVFSIQEVYRCPFCEMMNQEESSYIQLKKKSLNSIIEIKKPRGNK